MCKWKSFGNSYGTIKVICHGYLFMANLVYGSWQILFMDHGKFSLWIMAILAFRSWEFFCEHGKFSLWTMATSVILSYHVCCLYMSSSHFVFLMSTWQIYEFSKVVTWQVILIFVISTRQIYEFSKGCCMAINLMDHGKLFFPYHGNTTTWAMAILLKNHLYIISYFSNVANLLYGPWQT